MKNVGATLAISGSPPGAAVVWGLTERLREQKREPWPAQRVVAMMRSVPA